MPTNVKIQTIRGILKTFFDFNHAFYSPACWSYMDVTPATAST
jgi:hypothetical protein